MKRKIFLLTILIFSFFGNLQAQDAESAPEIPESQIIEEASDAKSQKQPRAKKERPPKKPRASKKDSEDASENAETGENTGASSNEARPASAQDAESLTDSTQTEENALEIPESQIIEETSDAKSQKQPRVKKERPPKKPRASKKDSEDVAENAEAGETEASPDEAQSASAQDAESSTDSPRAEEGALEISDLNEAESEKIPRAKKKSRGESEDDPEHWPTINELTANQYHFGILQNWGLSAAFVTRIQKKSDMSNFVWNDKMIGVFYEAKSHDFIRLSNNTELNFIARMAIYYPYNYTFRDVKQIPTQVILYAFDWFTAPTFSISFRDRIIFDTQLGLHIMYQLHDMWKYLNLGVGLKLNVEFPISSRWTLIAGGMFSYDNGNFGSNRNMRPFDYVWEYQAQLGARYCKKYLNRRSYIKYRPKPLKTKRVKKISPLSDETNLEIEVDIEEPKEEVNVEIEIPVENLPSAQFLPTEN